MSLLIEVAFPEASLRTTALEACNWDSSVPPSSFHHLFCSKVVSRMLADQVGLFHGKGVVTQTPPRAIHIHLHDLPIDPLLSCPGLSPPPPVPESETVNNFLVVLKASASFPFHSTFS